MTHPLVLFKLYGLGFMEMTLGVTADSVCLEMQRLCKAGEISAFTICRLICHWKTALFNIINVIESYYSTLLLYKSS